MTQPTRLFRFPQFTCIPVCVYSVLCNLMSMRIHMATTVTVHLRLILTGILPKCQFKMEKEGGIHGAVSTAQPLDRCQGSPHSYFSCLDITEIRPGILTIECRSLAWPLKKEETRVEIPHPGSTGGAQTRPGALGVCPVLSRLVLAAHSQPHHLLQVPDGWSCYEETGVHQHPAS